MPAILRSLKSWFLNHKAAKKSVCRPPRKARPGLEILEARELLSTTAIPTFVLTGGNLYQKPASAKTLIDSGVQSYQTDSRGDVAVLETSGVLKFYTAGSLTTIDSGVSAYRLDHTGALLELDSLGDLERYSTTTGVSLVDSGVQSIAFAASGRVYVLKSDGIFLGSSDGVPGNYQQIATGVKQLALASNGRVYILETGGAFLGSSDGLPGDFALLDLGVQSIGIVSTGQIEALQSNGLLMASTTGLPSSFTIVGRNITSFGVAINNTPVVADWFSENLTDAGVAAVARTDFGIDDAITRKDLLGLFAQAETGGTITAAELQSLRAVVDNAAQLNIPGYVDNLAAKTVEGDPADSRYHGQKLATLTAGSTSGILKDLVNKWFLGADLPASVSAYSAVGGALFAKSGPVYSDVQQGYLGDCWLVASLAETAARMPSVIKSMFIANGDGTWTVRFYNNGVATYVTVNDELPDGGYYYDQPRNGVLWAALAEKAFAQLNGNSYALLNGGDPSDALAQISGLPEQYSYSDASSVASAWAQGTLIVLSTGWSRPDASIVQDHSYALVNYNATTGIYTLFNPWGVNGGYSGGYYPGFITLSAKGVDANFDDYSVVGPSSSAAPAAVAPFGAVLPVVQSGTLPGGSPGQTVPAGRGGIAMAVDSQNADAVFLALSAQQHPGQQTNISLVGTNGEHPSADDVWMNGGFGMV